MDVLICGGCFWYMMLIFIGGWRRACFWALEPVCVHHAFAFDVDLAPWHCGVAGISRLQKNFGIVANLYLHGLTGRLHAGSSVDCVTKQAISWHLAPNDSSNNMPCIMNNSSLLTFDFGITILSTYQNETQPWFELWIWMSWTLSSWSTG